MRVCLVTPAYTFGDDSSGRVILFRLTRNEGEGHRGNSNQ